MKVIKSGDQIEVYKYNRNIVRAHINSQTLAANDGKNLNDKPFMKKKFENMTVKEYKYWLKYPEPISTDVKEYWNKYHKFDNFEDKEKTIRKKNWRRRKRKLKRKINANKKYMTKFLTLTFAKYKVKLKYPGIINGKEKKPGEHYYRQKPVVKDTINYKVEQVNDIDITDLEQTNYEFKKFKQKLKYRVEKNTDKELKYICVVERQKNNAAHYHLLLNIDFMSAKRIENLWGNGFIRINEIRFDGLGQYLSKMLKDLTKEEKQLDYKNKRYFCSRNLDKPKEMIGKEAEEYIKKIQKEGKTIDYSIEFENDYLSGTYYTFK
ncbi:MAG: rolling circle replication-associated protein [Candidatus Woesearchaeota archaeon]